MLQLTFYGGYISMNKLVEKLIKFVFGLDVVVETVSKDEYESKKRV